MARRYCAESGNRSKRHIMEYASAIEEVKILGGSRAKKYYTKRTTLKKSNLFLKNFCIPH
jgi:hypothetical protein